MRPDDEQFDDDALDELLSQARWPEPGEQSTRRLIRVYRRERIGFPRLAPLAAAAAMIAIGCMVWALNSKTAQPTQVSGVNPAPTIPATLTRPGTKTIESRPPTLREQFWIDVAIRESRESKSGSGDSSPAAPRVAETKVVVQDPQILLAQARNSDDSSRQRELLDQALEQSSRLDMRAYLQLVVDLKTSAVARSAILAAKNPPVDQLFGCLNDPLVPLRLAAAELLGEIDGPATAKRLAQMAVDNVNRREALIALLHCDSAEATSFLAMARQSSSMGPVVASLQIQLHRDL
jgi:hypothetical protein